MNKKVKICSVIFIHTFLLSILACLSWSSDNPETTPITSVYRKVEFTEENFDIVIEEEEVSTITGFKNAKRAFVLTPEIAKVRVDTASQVSITGVKIGSSYIHIWDDEGTLTLRAIIRRKGYKSGLLEMEKREKRKKAAPIRIEYSHKYNHRLIDYKNKDKINDWKAIDRTHQLSITGDTPYGSFDGDVSYLFKKDPSTEKKEDIQRINCEFNNRFFDLSLGDVSAFFTPLTLPITHIQGIRLRSPQKLRLPGIPVSIIEKYLKKIPSRKKEAFKSEVEYDFVAGQTGYYLWGSELLNFGEPKDIFYGLQTTVKPRSDLSFFAVGLAAGERAEKSRDATDFLGSLGADYRIEDYLDFGIEGAQNNEDRTAFTSSLDLNIDRLSLGATYRDVSVDYLNVTGTVPYKGKRGVYTKARFRPVDILSLSANFDVYQNRLNPDPDSVDKGNKDLGLNTELFCPPTETRLLVSYYHKHNKGQQFPVLTIGQQARLIQPIEDVFLLGNIKGELIYTMSKYKSFSPDVSNYKDVNIGGRLSANPIKGLSLYISETLDFREWFTRPDDYKTAPRRFGAGIGYSSRVGKLPVSVSMNLGYQKDSHINQDKSSSIIGEDKLTGSIDIRYSLMPSVSGFFKVSSEKVEGTVDPGLDRLSAEMYTGITWNWDTGFVMEGHGTVKGHVFKDIDRNGIMDKGDIPLKGAKIMIDEQRSAVTDSRGFYRIKYVKSGKRRVSLDLATIPEDYVSTTPLNLYIDIDRMDVKKMDFGIAPKATIQGFIFNDVNRNNKYDKYIDEVVPNVLVKIDDGKTGFTLGEGHFVIRGVSLGERTITLEKDTFPEGLMQGAPFSHKVEMKEGDTKVVEFILYAPRFIAGSVYIDKNENGKFDEGEGISGVKLTFIDKVVVTEKDGFFIFRDLPAGEEEIIVDKTTIPDKYRLREDKIEVKITEEKFERKDFNIELITGPDTAPRKGPSLPGLPQRRF